MKKILFSAILVLVLLMPLAGAEEKRLVLASTAWVAAFVRTAGVEEVIVLAPFELKHPPEYELKPSDIVSITKATHIVYAGYERMVSRLKENARKDAVFASITTQNDWETMKKSVNTLAGIFGTEKQAAANLKTIEVFIAKWKKQLETQGYYGKKVICHAYQEPLIATLGFIIAGSFGPAPLEAKQLVELKALNIKLIIDNYHNPVATPLSDTIIDSRTVVFINFPPKNTDLLAVLKTNKDILEKSLGASTGE